MAQAPHAPAKSDNTPPPAASAAPAENESVKQEREAIEAALHPKDFKLAKPGSRDYVAGQPVDDKELGEVTAEAEKRMKAGQNPKTAGGSRDGSRPGSSRSLAISRSTPGNNPDG